jgi:hypothetical protein
MRLDTTVFSSNRIKISNIDVDELYNSFRDILHLKAKLNMSNGTIRLRLKVNKRYSVPALYITDISDVSQEMHDKLIIKYLCSKYIIIGNKMSFEELYKERKYIEWTLERLDAVNLIYTDFINFNFKETYIAFEYTSIIVYKQCRHYLAIQSDALIYALKFSDTHVNVLCCVFENWLKQLLNTAYIRQIEMPFNMLENLLIIKGAYDTIPAYDKELSKHNWSNEELSEFGFRCFKSDIVSIDRDLTSGLLSDIKLKADVANRTGHCNIQEYIDFVKKAINILRSDSLISSFTVDKNGRLQVRKSRAYHKLTELMRNMLSQ